MGGLKRPLHSGLEGPSLRYCAAWLHGRLAPSRAPSWRTITGVTNQVGFALTGPGESFLEPQVVHVVQMDVLSTGDTNPPCGVSSSLVMNTPSSRMPALRKRCTIRNSLGSAMRCSRDLTRWVCDTGSKKPLMSAFTTHCGNQRV